MDLELEFQQNRNLIQQVLSVLSQKTVPPFFMSLKYTTEQVALLINKTPQYVGKKCSKQEFPFEKKGLYNRFSYQNVIEILQKECPDKIMPFMTDAGA